MPKAKPAPAKKTSKAAPKKAAGKCVTAMCDDKKWQAQDDLRTIQRAREIEQNKSRLMAAQREANAQMAALKSIAK